MFKSKKTFRPLLFSLLVASTVGIAIVGAVLAQDGPFIDYWPWEQRPGMAPSTPMETTPTPSDEEAKKLPKVTPPVIPTVEVIDTAPDVSLDAKYEIIVKRVKTGEMVVFKVQNTINPEEALATYLNGDYELVTMAPPPLGGPPPPPPSPISTQN